MPFIWFWFFDVGLLRKSVSIETILSLMQHVKSCASEKLVYILFWNLKGGLGRKKPKQTTEMPVISVAAPTTFTQWTVSASLHCMEKPFPFAPQAGSQLLRKNSISKISNSSRIWTSQTHSQMKDSVSASHLRQERSPAFNKLPAFDPKSQEPDQPHLIYSCWLFWSEWNDSSFSWKVWDTSSCPPAKIFQEALLQSCCDHRNHVVLARWLEPQSSTKAARQF